MASASKLVLRHPGRVQNTSISRDRIECGSIRLAPERPRTFQAVARQLRWCDALSTRYEKVYGIVHLREPKTRRMTGHATQQHVLLECLGICQLVNSMRSSIPDHKLDTPTWGFTAVQHFAYFQRQLRSLGVSYQHYTLHGLRGGGLPIIGFSIVIYHCYDAVVGGHVKEPLKDTFRKGLQRSCRPSQCSRRARASFRCRTRLQRVPPPAPATTTLQRKAWRSSLRSVQRRRATELCPRRLASRSVTFIS